ncbi:MAG: hypothetical protein KDE59_03180, partial [Anaerolineales bacterium]|nr:hypothetical protein [Anaerolineales bacterium]
AGTGAGTLANQVRFSVGNGPKDIASVDLDGDGDDDLAVSVYDLDRVDLLPNAGNLLTDYVGPAGDYSQLLTNGDGSYTRRYKDGTEVHFESRGFHTSTVDRNGNITSYQYNGQDRLSSVTDPAGLVTSFSYTGGYLQQITLPDGRSTQFNHDSNGDLVSVILPDSHSRQFGYDGQHRMTRETDENGEQKVRLYDELGAIQEVTLADGTFRQFNNSLSVGWTDVGATGTITNPAPLYRADDAISIMVDGESRSTSYTSGALGNFTGVTDPAGLTTTIERDADGNPLQTTLPSGASFLGSYDANGNLLSYTDQTVGGTTSFSYEPIFNQITTITDPFSQVTNFSYDGAGNLTGITTPLNRTVTFGYDSRGLLTSMVDPLGTTTGYTYNSAGLLTELSQGSGAAARTATMTYTGAGYLATLTDPLSRLFSYDYDTMGRLLSENLPGGRTISYSYDNAGNLASLTPPGRPAHTFSYNEINLLSRYTAPAVTGGGSNQTSYNYNFAQQLTQLTRPDGIAILYDYDTAGRLSQVTTPLGNYGYSYDPGSGQLANQSDPTDGGLAYSYNGELLSQVTWSGPVSGFVGYGYDAAARVSTLDINGQSFSFSYDADSMLTGAGALSLSYDPGSGLLDGTSLGTVSDSYSFNPFAELSSYVASAGGSPVLAVSYVRDALGRIIEKTETVNGVTTVYGYGYDPAGRLWQVTVDGLLQATYTYDTNGNRLNNGASYDAQDRLLTFDGASYSYTANGELTSRNDGGQLTSYTYDVMGNLRSVTLPDGTVISYEIDAADRRIGRRVNGALTQGFLYGDQLNPVAELDGAGNVISRFIYGSQGNVPAYMIRGGQSYRLISDHLGSVRLVINTSNGAIIQQLNYDAWGNVVQDTNPGFQPFAYAGGLYDAATGLTRFGARDYDAEVGRWTAKDPILFLGGHSNLYVYADNNILNVHDISGQSPFYGNYLGPGNYGYAAIPIDAIDAAARKHDIAYDMAGANGLLGTFFNLDVAGADLILARDAALSLGNNCGIEGELWAGGAMILFGFTGLYKSNINTLVSAANLAVNSLGQAVARLATALDPASWIPDNGPTDEYEYPYNPWRL